MRKILFIVMIIVAAGIVGWIVSPELPGIGDNQANLSDSDGSINSFEECIAAGFPVQESHPQRCIVSDEKSFTEEISEEAERDIIVSAPLIDARVTSPFQISGSATGSWYFEGNFSAELYDNEGNVIATAVLTAQEDWMTEGMVPFQGEIEFEEQYIGSSGDLILLSANPSGISENQREISISVRFE